MHSQQQQAEAYFRLSAEDWQRKAISDEAEFNIIRARNEAVLATLAGLPKARSLIDIGCGTGQLVIEAARRGIESIGIDFAKEMIDKSRENMDAAGVKAEFVFSSFFDVPTLDERYDVVSAQGFIEYIQPEEMKDFFARSFRMLSPGGALVVGSRNRLFNVLSLNDFTRMELDLGQLDRLIGESLALHMSDTQEQAFAAVREFERANPHPSQHPETGIGVSVRYQYTPAELLYHLRKCGFVPRSLYPIHFHALPSRVKDDHPRLHFQLATFIGEVAATDHRLSPFCSSFVLDVRKAA